jgi:hypothetical protein
MTCLLDVDRGNACQRFDALDLFEGEGQLLLFGAINQLQCAPM